VTSETTKTGKKKKEERASRLERLLPSWGVAIAGVSVGPSIREVTKGSAASLSVRGGKVERAWDGGDQDRFSRNENRCADYAPRIVLTG
jgi:hypothetical protein